MFAGGNALEVDQLLELYKQGQRNFSNIDLSNAQLRSVTLIGIDLRGSTLNKADLSSANLIDAKITVDSEFGKGSAFYVTFDFK